MKKIYAMMAAALLGVPSAFATMEVLPNDVSSFSIAFNLNGENSTVTGSFTASKYGPGYYDRDNGWVYVTPEIVGTIDLIEISRKTSDDSSIEPENVVLSYTDVEPGATIEFTDDKPFIYGHPYQYTVKCYSVDEDGKKSMASGAYGKSASDYVGEKAKAPVMTAYCDPENPTLLKVKVVAPTLDYKDRELTVPLTRLEVSKYIAYDNQPVIWTYDNPEFGEEVEFTLDIYEQGETAQLAPYAISDYGKSEKKDYAFWIGYDAPASPKNVKVISNEDGSATIVWEAPEEGKNGGIFVEDGMTFKVTRRGTGWSDKASVIGEGIEGLSFVDPCDELTGPAQFIYQVIACNEYGESKGADSSIAIVGPACALPFYESFNNSSYSGGPLQMWAKEGDDHVSYSKENYSYGLKGCGPNQNYYGEGFALFSLTYVYSETTSSLVSPKIDLREAEHPVLSFYAVPVNGNVNELTVAARAESLEEDLDLMSINNEDGELGKYEWKKYSVALDDIAGETANVIFSGYCPGDVDGKTNLFFDEVLIDDYKAVKTIKAEPKDDGTTLITWEVPSNSSFGEPDAYLVTINDEEPVLVSNKPAENPEEGEEGEEVEPALLSEDGEVEAEEPVEEVWIPRHSFTHEIGKNYSVKIKALYGDIEANHSEPLEFIGGSGVGVEMISVDTVKNVEYFDVNGLRVEAPAKGQIVIKRIEGANGAVKMQKVVF